MQNPEPMPVQNHRIEVEKYCEFLYLWLAPKRFFFFSPHFGLFISGLLALVSQPSSAWAEFWVLHVCISMQQKLSYCLYYLCALGCDFSFQSSVTNWCAWTGDTKERIWTYIGMGFISHCTALVWAGFTDKSCILAPEVSNRIIL